jgi:hypothetical protein
MSSWKIVRWDPRSKRGAIQGAHIGPVEFDERSTEVADYCKGEAVDAKVTLEGGVYCVTHVEPLAARQPAGTEASELKDGNGFFDYEILSMEADRLVIGGGNSTAYGFECAITFEGVSFVQLAPQFSHALFRRASTDEKESLTVPIAAQQLFCVVTEHGNGEDGPRFFIAADSASVRRAFVQRRRVE